MPPKKIAERWGIAHKNAILKGFRECDWDPMETSGKNINALIKSAPPAILSILKPHFSTSDGGTKANNNTLYQHYKDIGCEFIVERTRAGWR